MGPRLEYSSSAGDTWDYSNEWQNLTDQASRVSPNEPAQQPMKIHAPRAKIKCTYETCHRHFRSVKDMQAHKKAEPEHEYCHRCDVDCDDDSDLLIHMIESDKHIVCPICGDEFKSNSGLEMHIAQRHRARQELTCVGCDEKFTSAGAVVKHIEDNQCSRISQETFVVRKAEKAMVKDQWEKKLESKSDDGEDRVGTTITSDSDTAGGGVSLLDRGEDWVPQTHLKPQVLAPNHPSTNQTPINESDLNQYPQLGRTAPSKTSGAENIVPGPSTAQDEAAAANPWSPTSPAASSLFPDSAAPLLAHPASNPTSSTSQPPLSTNPNAHILTSAAPLRPLPALDRNACYNHVTKLFECPGILCIQKFTSLALFEAHLRSPEHIRDTVVCPGCARHFTSTAALVSHCESPSRKCNIRHAANFNQILRDITAGLLGTHGHHTDGSVKIVANDVSESGFW